MTGVPNPSAKILPDYGVFVGLLIINRGIRLSDFGLLSMQELSA